MPKHFSVSSQRLWPLRLKFFFPSFPQRPSLLMVVMPALASEGGRFHPIGLFSEFDMRVAKTHDAAAKMPFVNPIAGIIRGDIAVGEAAAGKISRRVGDIANGDHVRRN